MHVLMGTRALGSVCLGAWGEGGCLWCAQVQVWCAQVQAQGGGDTVFAYSGEACTRLVTRKVRACEEARLHAIEFLKLCTPLPPRPCRVPAGDLLTTLKCLLIVSAQCPSKSERTRDELEHHARLTAWWHTRSDEEALMFLWMHVLMRVLKSVPLWKQVSCHGCPLTVRAGGRRAHAWCVRVRGHE